MLVVQSCCSCFRLNTVYEWTQCLNPPAGRLTDRAHSTSELGYGVQGSHHHTQPHELWKRGESMLSQNLMNWGNEVSQCHRTSWNGEMRWVNVDITGPHERRKWGMLISHDLMKSGYLWHDLRKLVISHEHILFELNWTLWFYQQ